MMFIVLITYKKPLVIVDQHLAEHRMFLEKGYQQQLLMASGPQTPRTGGILLSQCSDRHALETFLAQDPFLIHDVADYTIIEFTPVKYHEALRGFIESN